MKTYTQKDLDTLAKAKAELSVIHSRMLSLENTLDGLQDKQIHRDLVGENSEWDRAWTASRFLEISVCNNMEHIKNWMDSEAWCQALR